ncbi:MAG TPA: type IV pilus modification protein PilV [Candidatus Tenderia electrophaga]|uniref:Type IV pilus modification protein PilV n=1 Tax=Candidatus Tenderia electrophaga TaxID=1748243 RepID=A0A832N6G5_9GAMM|nr:type IV pilus modification protein PilV [Candidatus Tenderia electrophaga]
MHGDTRHCHQAGFSLIEVLITMVVLSIGLLGVAGMQASGLRNNHAAYTKTQATNLAMDMAERIRANPQGQAEYVGFSSDSAPDSSPDCISTGCTPIQLANHDKFEWSQPFNADSKPVLPAGKGLVTQDGNQFIVTILWREVAYDGMDFNNCMEDMADDMACFQLRFQP